MNTWGRLLRVSVFGESHGAGVGAVVDGLPPGTAVDLARLQADLDARRPGTRATESPRAEADRVEVLSGTLAGRATGAPIALWIRNEDVRSQDYDTHLPRPGHADWTQNHATAGHADLRGGGHLSGRLTAPLVAAGSLAQALLDVEGVRTGAHVHAVGGIDGTGDPDAAAMAHAARNAPMRTAHPEADAMAFARHVEEARHAQDSVGGVVAFRADAVPPGLGDPWMDPLESTLAHLLFAVPAVKAVGFGAGSAAARMSGSAHNDPIGRQGMLGNQAGGILGGRTTGMPVTGQVSFKPASSIPRPQATVDLRTGEPAETRVRGRHDPCLALRGALVVEACLRLALADALLVARARAPSARAEGTA